MKFFVVLLLAISACAAPVAKPLFGDSIAVGESVDDDIAEVEATLDDILSEREPLFGGSIAVGESVDDDITEVEATLDDILSKREPLFGGSIAVGEVSTFELLKTNMANRY
jgi:hypothetical protein